MPILDNDDDGNPFLYVKDRETLDKIRGPMELVLIRHNGPGRSYQRLLMLSPNHKPEAMQEYRLRLSQGWQLAKHHRDLTIPCDPVRLRPPTPAPVQPQANRQRRKEIQTAARASQVIRNGQLVAAADRN